MEIVDQKKFKEMTDTDITNLGKFTKSILEALEAAEDFICNGEKGKCKIFVINGAFGKYMFSVIVDEHDVAIITVNEYSRKIEISFNFDTDPDVVGNIVLQMREVDNVEIYESYRFDSEGNMLWLDDDKEKWIPEESEAAKARLEKARERNRVSWKKN